MRGDEKAKVKSIVKSKFYLKKLFNYPTGVTIKTKHGQTKFKLRCPRYLYTLKINDQVKADKIKSSIPAGINLA